MKLPASVTLSLLMTRRRRRILDRRAEGCAARRRPIAASEASAAHRSGCRGRGPSCGTMSEGVEERDGRTAAPRIGSASSTEDRASPSAELGASHRLGRVVDLRPSAASAAACFTRRQTDATAAAGAAPGRKVASPLVHGADRWRERVGAEQRAQLRTGRGRRRESRGVRHSRRRGEAGRAGRERGRSTPEAGWPRGTSPTERIASATPRRPRKRRRFVEDVVRHRGAAASDRGGAAARCALRTSRTASPGETVTANGQVGGGAGERAARRRMGSHAADIVHKALDGGLLVVVPQPPAVSSSAVEAAPSAARRTFGAVPVERTCSAAGRQTASQRLCRCAEPCDEVTSLRVAAGSAFARRARGPELELLRQKASSRLRRRLRVGGPRGRELASSAASHCTDGSAPSASGADAHHSRHARSAADRVGGASRFERVRDGGAKGVRSAI